MDKKKIKLMFVLSVFCIICVVSEAEVREYKESGAAENTGSTTVMASRQEQQDNTVSTGITASGPAVASSEENVENQGTAVPVHTKRPVQIVQAWRAAASEKVRVIITTNNFDSYYHNTVKLTCGNDFTVTCGDSTKTYKAGKKVSFSLSDKLVKKKKFVVASTGDARIKLLSVKRQAINPLYRGTIEVKWTGRGFLIINELPLEQYLYAVVPSEMSTGNRMEALKAQAVCARSYTYNQINAERYKEYNADLDDSTACQVYNNIPEDERSRKAVDSTFEEVITSKGKIIVAYYFSTSWGYTADGQDVWNTPGEVSYLKSRPQLRNGKDSTGTDLSDENAFRQFINSGSKDAYESSDDWYRWNITFNADKLSERIDSALYNCYLSDKSLVLSQNNNGKYEEKPLKSIGRIKKLRVEKREDSGLITELVIVGTNNVVKVCTQYNIRKVLAPVYEKIKRKSGESISSYSMLPSAAFYIDDIKTKKGVSFKITGGGFGHGAGLSQSGAAAMAQSGKEYVDILEHFFTGAKVKSVKKTESAAN